ncbi:MAG: ABC transporter permease [Nanoarchaeota archaeon]
MSKKERKNKKLGKFRKNSVFGELSNIIVKNFKLIARSKTSSLIVLLGPLLIIALVGTAYNTSNIYDIRIGAYSPSYSELSNSILGTIGEQFSIIKLDSKEDCIAGLKSSQLHVCAIIPENLGVGSPDPIDFHVDQSRVNLVWIVIDAINTEVGEKKSELSLELTSAILNVLDDARIKIEDKKSTLVSVSETNKEILGNVEGLSESLGSFGDIKDFIDISKISQKLDEVVSANNLSSEPFEPVKQTIRNVLNNTESFGKELEESTLVLQDVRSGISGSAEDLDDVMGSLERIESNIQGVLGTSAETVVSPIKTNVTPVVTEKTHLSFLFPTLLVLVIMLIGLLLSSGLIVRERSSSAYFRNFITPTKDGVFILGHFLTNFIILIVQLIIIMVIATIFFKDDLVNVLYASSISLFVICAVFVLIGMLLGYIFKSEETAMLAVICVASLFLFFSSTILPLETLPSYLKGIADFNPFVLSEGILKKVMLFKYELGGIRQSLLILVSYIGLLGILVFGTQKLSKRQLQ